MFDLIVVGNIVFGVIGFHHRNNEEDEIVTNTGGRSEYYLGSLLTIQRL